MLFPLEIATLLHEIHMSFLELGSRLVELELRVWVPSLKQISNFGKGRFQKCWGKKGVRLLKQKRWIHVFIYLPYSIHVWYLYLHLLSISTKCRCIYHAWTVWVCIHLPVFPVEVRKSQIVVLFLSCFFPVYTTNSHRWSAFMLFFCMDLWL